jgi:hypothetical protein
MESRKVKDQQRADHHFLHIIDSSITKLVPEILLNIFEHIAQDPNASLVASMLSCKKWHPLAQSILYRDIFLSPDRLIKFLDNSADFPNIRSLTVRMDIIPVYETTEAAQTAITRLEALERLCPRIKNMSLLSSFSISVHFIRPFTVSRLISSMLDRLPNSCTSLEIDIRQHTFIDPTSLSDQHRMAHQQTSHICNSIRTLLPQLVHLRLRCLEICSALFGIDQAHGEDTHFEAITAPKLKTCLINLSLQTPGTSSYDGNSATRCSDAATQIPPSLTRFPPALPPLLPALQDFANLNSTHLERLWIIDVQLRNPTRPHAWAAWVRRDVLLDTSFPIPVARHSIRVSQPVSFDTVWMARTPTEQGVGVEDWLSPAEHLERLEGVAEGSAWSKTETGVRLATPMLLGGERVSRAMTRAQFEKGSNRTCTLWQNEKAAGEKLLPEGPGLLMKMWDLNERTPRGWRRANAEGSPLVQV